MTKHLDATLDAVAAPTFEEQRVEAIARARYERYTGKSWERTIAGVKESYLLGVSQDIKDDPATARLAELEAMLKKCRQLISDLADLGNDDADVWSLIGKLIVRAIQLDDEIRGPQ